MQRVRVGDVMKRQIVTIGATDRLSTVEDIMTLGRVRHMPVVNAGRLVGVVSERDLLRVSLSSLATTDRRARRKFLDGIEIASVMSAPAIVIDPKAALSDAARIMLDGRIGCLPVVSDRGELLGLITESDLLCSLSRAPSDVLPDAHGAAAG